MNVLPSGDFLRKHPILTTQAAILSAFIALKVVHYLPLKNSTEDYMTMLRDNGYDLDPLIKEYVSINPHSTTVYGFGDDTIIVIDYSNNKTFAITCSSGFLERGSVFTLSDKEICSLRDNPYTIKITGTVFGKTIPLPGSIVRLPLNIGQGARI